MLGNVWEWTEDCWNDSYPGALTRGSAWMSGDCSQRVLRGGTWDDYPKYLRAADRYWSDTGDRGIMGTRVARSIGSPQKLILMTRRRLTAPVRGAWWPVPVRAGAAGQSARRGVPPAYASMRNR
jgi:hypothetical protein